MALDTLRSLILDQRVFYLALLCVLGGPLVPPAAVGPLQARTIVTAAGGLYVAVRLLYGVGLVVRGSYAGGRSGYAEGTKDGK